MDRLHAALSHDSPNIYMFTLTISICCFWNNQRQGCKQKRGEKAVSRAQLGFHDWEAGPDYARPGLGERRVFFFVSSRPSQGFWGLLGICTSLPSKRSLTKGEISHYRLVTPFFIQLARAEVTNGFQIRCKINHKIQIWSKTMWLIMRNAIKLQQKNVEKAWWRLIKMFSSEMFAYLLNFSFF